MAWPEPRNLDDIYGPGAETADVGIDDEEELEQCAECDHTWPASELENGVCPDCLLGRGRSSI